MKAYTTGLDAAHKKTKTEYGAYVIYQECLLRGEVERMNLPGDEGNVEEDKGEGSSGGAQGNDNKGRGWDMRDDDGGDESEEYFPDELWPPHLRVSAARK